MTKRKLSATDAATGPTKKPLFMIPTEGKTAEEISDEVIAALRAQGIEVAEDEAEG
jgi:hypothetical protein